MDSLSVRGGIINLCNTCIGIGILAKPFALAISGWIGISVFVIAGIFIIYVGICLSDASRELLVNKPSNPIINTKKINQNYNIINNSNKNTSKSNKSAYQLLSYKSMGNKGQYFAAFGFIIMAFNFLAICIIMIFELITSIKTEIIPHFYVNTTLIFILSVIIYLPTALILKWKQITFISWIGVISVIAIFISLIGIMLYSFYEFDYKPPP
eukprot:442446_1